MLRSFCLGCLAIAIGLFPLPLSAQENAPTDGEITEFNKKWINSLEKYSSNEDINETLGIFYATSLASYNCQLIEEGIVRPDAVEDLLTRFYLEIYDIARRDMAIHMSSAILSDYILYPKNVVKLCDPKRILPKFKGLPISPLE